MAKELMTHERSYRMTLGQFLLLILIVVAFWGASKIKKHGERLDKLEGKDKDE
ncbi:hypothetical protein ACFL3G_00370 [Planctomycetota bacterium]